MAAAARTMAAAAMLAAAGAATAARPGAIAARSRGSVAITASVAGLARLTEDANGFCLWSNTATRLIHLSVSDAAASPPTMGAAMIAAPAPGCADHGRPILAARAGGARTILVSPE